MKIWVGHGSEHSSSVVLIGHFASVEDARLTEERLEALTELALKQPDPNWERLEEWFDDRTRAELNVLKLWQIGPGDLDNFRYIDPVTRTNDVIEVTTDEFELQGLIKVMILAGARVEVYSRREWTPDGKPIPDEPSESTGAASGPE